MTLHICTKCLSMSRRKLINSEKNLSIQSNYPNFPFSRYPLTNGHDPGYCMPIFRSDYVNGIYSDDG